MSNGIPDELSPPRPPKALSPLGQMLDGLRPSRRMMSEDERHLVTDELFWESEELTAHLVRFFVLIVLSTLLAAFGLAANSVAVIIGAMLVAPLMTPILATAASLLVADLKMLLSSVAVIAAGVVMAIGTSMVVTFVGLQNFTTVYSLPSEILGRTQPSLLDLGVAIAAGLAGGYVLTHPKASSSLPGVAIAVALVPPLATVGILLQIGATSQAGGAFLLFLTNLFAIVLSAIVVMLLSGFVPPEIRLEGFRNARIGLFVSAVVLVAIAVPLTVHTVGVVQDQRFAQTVTAEVATWDPNATIEGLVADLQPGGRAEVDLVVSTTSSAPQPSWKLADAVSAQIGRVVDMSVRYRLEVADESTSG
ncbi:MAG: TIGR00341 family protein [Acidimicrobiia bacterium]